MNKVHKNNLIIVQRIFPHYRRAIFKALAEKFSLRLMHGADEGDIPQTTESFSVFCKNYFFCKVTYQENLLAIIRSRPTALVQEFSLSFLNLYLNYLLSKVWGVKFILWGHGYDRSIGFDPEKRFSDKLRLFFIKNSEGCILYSDDVKSELLNFAPKVKFTVARNSIDSQEKEKIFSSLCKKDRVKDSVLRLCFVARLSENKKVELLSAIALFLKKRNEPFFITVVGDGECKEALINQCQAEGVFENFNFLGAVYDEELVADVIFNSDFMVIPAWCGLSINHSFCYATPLATLRNQQHPPEIQFAHDGYNAVLANSIEDLVERLVNIKSDKTLFDLMRENARNFYEQQLSIAAMLKGFTDAISNND